MSYKSIEVFFLNLPVSVRRNDTKSLRRYFHLNVLSLRLSDLAFKIQLPIAIGNLPNYQIQVVSLILRVYL